ncbi:hypothetical protein ACQ86D_24250 [Streptomyces galilaeus]
MHEMVKGGNVGLASLSEDIGSVLMSLSWGARRERATRTSPYCC